MTPDPEHDVPTWEPEPLHAPLAPPPRLDDEDDEEDAPQAGVLIIDLN